MPTQFSPELCKKLKSLGYARDGRVKLYGQDFQLLSDPFDDGTAVVVKAITAKNKNEQVLRIPKPVVLAAMGRTAA
jgi:hypothetical protein